MSLAKWIGFGAGNPTNGHTEPGTSAAAAAAAEAKAVEISKAEYKQFGYENFGNTCYANSVLQALYFCHPFRELVVQSPDKSNPLLPTNVATPLPSSPTPQSVSRSKSARAPSSTEKGKGLDNAIANGNTQLTGPPIPPSPPTLFSALRALFLHISKNGLDRGVVSPKAFVEKLKKENELFRSTMHQDAHEFLNYLLNRVAEDLEEEWKNRSRTSLSEDLSASTTSDETPSTRTQLTSNANQPHATLVHNLFEGTLTSETRCLTCETVSSRDESFLDLSIDIEQNSSVTACLRQFSASEMLCQKNKFFCDACCGLQEAEKRMKIKKLPNVLALHLKRFKYQDEVQKYIKLTYRVAFPLELRLFNTVDDAQDPDRLYQLFAIVVHIGNGPHHGHYVAIVKSRGSWVVFDDDTVDTIKESDIPKYFGDSNNGSAYVLYYQAVDLDLAALGLRTEDPPAPEIAVIGTPPKQSTQLLPPGLSVDADSDSNEPVASTSSSSSPSKPASPVPQLTVSIPPPTAAPEAPVTTAPASAPATTPTSKTSFFSLRHTTSLRGLTSSANRTPTHNASLPPIPSASPTTATADLPSADASTSLLVPLTNGKVKPPKERSSGWFSIRRSLKVEKSPEIPPTSPRLPSSFEEAKPLPAVALPEPGISKNSTTRPQTSSSSADSLLHDVPASLAVPASIPSIPSTSSASSYGQQQQPPHHPPDHKKSHPTLKSKPISGTSSRRPSTAGAMPSSPSRSHQDPSSIPPLPPLPANVHDPPPPTASENVLDRSTPRHTLHHRNSSHVQSTVPQPSNTLKRASRKLSLTSGMFFGRRDKDKHKDKDKTAFDANPLRSDHASTVPGMSMIGRL